MVFVILKKKNNVPNPLGNTKSNKGTTTTTTNVNLMQRMKRKISFEKSPPYHFYLILMELSQSMHISRNNWNELNWIDFFFLPAQCRAQWNEREKNPQRQTHTHFTWLHVILFDFRSSVVFAFIFSQIKFSLTSLCAHLCYVPHCFSFALQINSLNN